MDIWIRVSPHSNDNDSADVPQRNNPSPLVQPMMDRQLIVEEDMVSTTEDAEPLHDDNVRQNEQLLQQQSNPRNLTLTKILEMKQNSGGQFANFISNLIDIYLTPAEIFSPIFEGLKKLDEMKTIVYRAWPDLEGEEILVQAFVDEIQAAQNGLRGKFYREFGRAAFVLMTNDAKKEIALIDNLDDIKGFIQYGEYVLGKKAVIGTNHKFYKVFKEGNNYKEFFLFKRTR